MKVDGQDFNHEWAKSKSEADFVKEFSTPNMGHIYPDAKDKAAKLKEVHAVLLKAPLESESKPKTPIVSLATNNPGQGIQMTK